MPTHAKRQAVNIYDAMARSLLIYAALGTPSGRVTNVPKLIAAANTATTVRDEDMSM